MSVALTWYKEPFGRHPWWRYCADSRHPFATSRAYIRRNWIEGGYVATIQPPHVGEREETKNFKAIPPAKRWVESRLNPSP